MMSNVVGQAVTPLKTIDGSYHHLAVYSDRLVIHRHDFLSQLLGHDIVIRLKDITDIRLYSSRFTNSHWVHLAIFSQRREPVGLNYHLHQEHEVHEIKDTIERLRGAGSGGQMASASA